MDSKKAGILFIVIGISAILSFLIYPHLKEKTEMAVPVLKSFSDVSASENTDNSNLEIWENTTDNPTAEAALPDDDFQPETVSAVVFPIDINAASAEELMQIKNIGKVIAENIISYRENHGYFYSAEDLLNVDGIGEKKLENIRDYIYVDKTLLPETASSVRETVTKTETSSATVTTVPTSQSSVSKKQTSVKTKVTAAETEDPDDGRIIEEITDFEDVSQRDEQEFSTTEKTTVDLFFYVETTSEEYRPNFPLELNTASAKDLTYIDGIGETLAQRIVEYARSRGFYDVNELLNVSGIGQSKFNAILPYVYVDTSGLPPRPETAASDFYSDIWETSNTFPTETTVPAAPEIYRVNINTAGKADFMQLPGIDEALADSIISLRNQIGGFANIEELSLAEGMTNSRLSAIWNYIYV